jgi:SNF2 family DNA or RNA helicase
VFTISYDALLTKRGKDALETFVTVEPCLLVADESSRIKNPKAKRTKIALKLSTLAAYRRILTGTPASNSPFDLYSQFLFLAQDFWSRQGIASWWAFRSRYGKFEQSYIFCHGASRDFMKLVGYQNESDLATRIAPVSSRLRLADCINMPERIYKTITFDLAPEARRLYNSLRTEFYAAIDTRMMTAALALTRMLRLQQIASGILTTDDGVTTAMPCGRLEILKEILEDGGTAPTLVWTRFIPTAMAAMALLGARARRFDGSVSEADRQTALADFALGKFQFLVINLASGSFGFNMQTATRSIFLERSFAAEQRQQAEARNYRIGQTLPTIVIDIVAQDTVDGHILEALARKEDISKKILGGDLARAKNLV